MKKVPRVFFQNKCSGTNTKVRSGCRRSPLSPPSSPILSIPFSLEIDPLGIYHLSLARHALDSGFTAAWGQYSCVPLWKQYHDSCISRGKFYAKSCKIPCTMLLFCDCDQSCPWQGRTLSPPAKRHAPPSPDPSQHACYLMVLSRDLKKRYSL